MDVLLTHGYFLHEDPKELQIMKPYAPLGLLRSSWEERSGERFTIDAAAGRLQAAIDGEPERLETPIEFTIEPRGLRVLVPRSPDA